MLSRGVPPPLAGGEIPPAVQERKKKVVIMKQEKQNHWELFNDHFQNFKSYGLPKAQLIIADIPFNVGKNAYGSNPAWYVDGDNKNGESALAGKEFFDTDKDFRVSEFLHFCSQMLIKEPKERGKAPAMMVFCEFEQQFELIEKAKKYGLNHYINLVFRKNFSAQVLKANMRIVGNCEYGLVLYREKLPKFNNGGKMIFNCFDVERDTDTPKIHPTQKSIPLLEKIITVFTDENDIVIDPCAGSGTTLLAAANLNRSAYGFEIKKPFFNEAIKLLNDKKQEIEDVKKYGFDVTAVNKIQPSLFFEAN